jgi:hypothetical protein
MLAKVAHPSPAVVPGFQALARPFSKSYGHLGYQCYNAFFFVRQWDKLMVSLCRWQAFSS